MNRVMEIARHGQRTVNRKTASEALIRVRDFLEFEAAKQWEQGEQRIPGKIRAFLTDRLLVHSLRERSRPGSWDNACRRVPELKKDLLTDAFRRGGEWGWKLAASRLRKMNDQQFIMFFRESTPGICAVNDLHRELEHQQATGLKVKQGASTGGKGRRGKTKVQREPVVKCVNELRVLHPQHSPDRIYQLAGKRFHISARTVRTYVKG